MINKINDGTNFKAKIITSIHTPKAQRLKNISEMFEEATKQYKKDSLYLTKGHYSGVMSIHTNNQKKGDIFEGEEIFTDSLEEHFETMTDKEIVSKLTNAFKVLRLSGITKDVKFEIKEQKQKLQRNLAIAKRLRSIGRDNFAEKYELFAKFNQEKLDKLYPKLNNLKDSFFKQREKSAKEFPEVGQVDI